MKFKIIGWQSQGLRCPDVQVDLRLNKRLPRVALIQMPNGTGKTTTLAMIRAAMTGEARNWSSEQVRAYQRKDSGERQGQFLLRLEVDESPLTFEMKFDFSEGRVTYRTTTPSSGGVVADWRPPSNARRFLNEQFVSLFVFDGELAERLLDPKEAEAERAVEALCQLYLVDRIAALAEVAWERATQGAGPRTQTGLTMYKNKADKLSQQIKKITDIQTKARSEFDRLSREIDQLRSEIDKGLTSEEREREELERRKSEEASLGRDVTQKTVHAMAGLRRPPVLHPLFASALLFLKQNLDRVKLPESSSRQFFVELAQEAECVCGRPMDARARQNILEQADRYLGEDMSGVVNALKRDIELHTGQGETPISRLMEDLRVKANEWHRAKTEREALEQELISRGSEDVQEKKRRCYELEQKRNELEDLLREIEGKAVESDDEESRCLASLQKQLKATRDKMAEIAGTLELRNRTDVLKRAATRVKQIAFENIREQLVVEINRRLTQVLAKEPVVVGGVERSVRLQQAGASVGQTLAVGYVFLASLLHRGQHQFPLLVDSPANPIDLGVRRQIGAMVPELCEQFVGLTISSEREGFVPAMAASAGTSIKYLTLFRKTARTESLRRKLPVAGVVETESGILVEGKDYFEQFDLDEV